MGKSFVSTAVFDNLELGGCIALDNLRQDFSVSEDCWSKVEGGAF